VDGHDVNALIATYDEARRTKGKPTVVLARTIMGKHVSFMEDDYHWHGKPPKKDEGERALVELGTTYEAWKARVLAG
jgi:transketolase